MKEFYYFNLNGLNILGKWCVRVKGVNNDLEDIHVNSEKDAKKICKIFNDYERLLIKAKINKVIT